MKTETKQEMKRPTFSANEFWLLENGVKVAECKFIGEAFKFAETLNHFSEMRDALEKCEGLFKHFDNRADWPELQEALKKTRAILAKVKEAE